MSLTDSLCTHEDPVVAFRARRLLAAESESSAGMRRLRRAIGSSTLAVEWTNVKQADQIVCRGTYADWGPLSKRRANPLVTVDALWVLQQAGRSA